MKKCILSLIYLFIFFHQALFSQICEPGIPLSMKEAIPINLVFTELQPVNTEILLRDDSADTGLKPFRYGQMISTDFNPDNSGVRFETEKGDMIWMMGIRSAGAKSLSVIFHDFKLPQGAKVFVYDSEHKNFSGAFTSDNNKTDEILPVAPLPGDEIIIEYDEPADVIFSGSLCISYVIHDYRGIFKYLDKDGNFGHSGSCNIDINCPAGSEWQRDKHSVCRLITNGVLCSGTLVNNTANDGTPYFMTANHCMNTQTAASNLILYYNYESPECHGPDGQTSQTTAGSTLKATTNALDFCLVKLSETPPAVYKPFYAGWNNVNSPARRSVCIHHPQGDVKKISVDNDSPVTGNYGGTYDVNSHWQIIAWDMGTTEGGSSGSPLFDQYHHVTGDLTGGEASCSNSVNDYFAKFCRSWNDYTDSSAQLKHWLDPGNTGQTTLNGYDPYYGDQVPVADFVAWPTTIMAGASVDFIDISQGNVFIWNWSFPGAETVSSTDQNPSGIVYLTPGDYNVVLTAGNNTASNSKSKTAYIHVVPGCNEYSNIGLTENLALYSFSGGEWGYWTGQNEHHFDEFAEKYSGIGGSFVHGVTITPGRAYHGSIASVITVKIWAGGPLPGDVLYARNILISQFTPGVGLYIPFSPTVYTGSDFYAGYQVYYDFPDTFAVLHAFPRGTGELNTFYVKENDAWSPVTSFSSSFTTSLTVKPKVCGLQESDPVIMPGTGITVFPDPSSGIITVETGLSGNQSGKIDIFDLFGKQVGKSLNVPVGQESLSIDLSIYRPGLYFIRLIAGNQTGTAKFMIVK